METIYYYLDKLCVPDDIFFLTNRPAKTNMQTRSGWGCSGG